MDAEENFLTEIKENGEIEKIVNFTYNLTILSKGR